MTVTDIQAVKPDYTKWNFEFKYGYGQTGLVARCCTIVQFILIKFLTPSTKEADGYENSSNPTPNPLIFFFWEKRM